MRRKIAIQALTVVCLFLAVAFNPVLGEINPEIDTKVNETEVFTRAKDEIPSPFLKLKILASDLMSATDNLTDTDGDQIPDNVERVLGTQWNNSDSDFDKLSDHFEIFNNMDPNDPDSNGDHMPDYYEVNEVPLDLDGDGVPNAWDWDNDGDGVMDDLDMSPFARTITCEGYDLTLNFGESPTFISFQVRTIDPSHMMLFYQVWDWPNDNTGMIRDLDNSIDDLHITPVLEFKSDTLPDAEELGDFGISVVDDTAYVPVHPVWEFGKIVAMKGRMVYPKGTTQQDISASLNLSWKVSGKTDTLTKGFQTSNGKYLSCDPQGNITASAVSIDSDETFDWINAGSGKISLKAPNGRYVSVSSDGNVSATSEEVGDPEIFETVASGGDITLKAYNSMYLTLKGDGRLVADGPYKISGAQLKAVDLGARFDMVHMVTYYEDFMLTGMNMEENHGTKAGVFYDDDMEEMVSTNLILAYDFLRNGSYEMEDMPSHLADEYNISVENIIKSFEHRDQALKALTKDMIQAALDNISSTDLLPVIAAVEDRSRSLDLSDLSDQTMDMGGILDLDVNDRDLITSRSLKTTWYNMSTDEPLELSEVAEEMRGWDISDDAKNTCIALTLAWGTGETRIISIGSTVIDYSSTLNEKTNVDLVALDIISESICCMEGIKDIVYLVKATYCYVNPARVASLAKATGTTIDSLSDAMKAVSKIKTGALGVLNRIGTALEIIGILIDIAIVGYAIWAIGDAFGWTPTGTGVAVSYGILMAVYAASLIILSICGGPVGIVIAMLIALSDLLAFLMCGSSWSEQLFGAIVEWFIDIFSDMRTRSEVDLEVNSAEADIQDLDNNGMDAGDLITYQANVSGVVTTTSDGSYGDLVDSYITPTFSVWTPGYTRSKVTTYSNKGSSSISGNKKTTDYELGLTVEPGTGMINYPIAIDLTTSYRVYYDDCWWFFGWHCDREDYYGTSSTRWTILRFDVMPGTISDFAKWTAIRSNDHDGDGINNTDETSTSPWKWDTDGDGLGDMYEKQIGTDPSMADTDEDGLNDRTELQLGISNHDRDSDGDGLSDLIEYSGWIVDFDFCGESFHWRVNSDPGFNDTDGDGVSDYHEYFCLLNPMSYDTDGDGTDDRLVDYYMTYIDYDMTIDIPSGWTAYPEYIDISPDRCLYVLFDNHTIVKYDANGTILKIKTLTVDYLSGISIDIFGNVYVSVTISNYGYIHKLDSNLSFLDSYSYLYGGPQTFDEENGFAYLFDWECRYILKLYKSNFTTIKYWRPDPSSAGVYNMDLDEDGNLLAPTYYSYDQVSHIVVYDPNGTVIDTIGIQGPGEGQFNKPTDIDVCSDGDILVVDSGNHRIQKLRSDGKWLATFGSGDPGSNNSSLDDPRELAMDDDHLYVVDHNNRRIQKLDHEVVLVKAEPESNYTDSDGDGLSDVNETLGYNVTATNAITFTESTYHVTSEPNVTDTDGDGLDDMGEFNHRSDPRSTDTDGDGLSDNDEADLGLDPCHWDTDGDGLDDGIELTFGSDPRLPDTDSEGLDDLAEFLAGSDPNSNDTDGDGLEDDEEYSLGSDLSDPDSDDDLMGDAQEREEGTDPNCNDTDGDDLPDGFETLYMTAPSDPDSDGDGVPDGFEVDKGIDPLSNDTDGDGVDDGIELMAGLNPRRQDTDGDGVPDSLDISHTLELDGSIVLVMDPSDEGMAFAENLSNEASVEEVTVSELLDEHGSSPYIVLVGNPDGGNGTAGSLIRELIEGTEELDRMMNSSYHQMTVRYGVWSPTQTVIMISEPGPYGHLEVLGMLKSRRVTVTENSYRTEYREPICCAKQDHRDALKATDSLVWLKLDRRAAFNMTVSRYDQNSTPETLSHQGGMKPGEIAMGKYVGINLSENVWNRDAGIDLVSGAEVRIYYTVDDLNMNGDGDHDDPLDLDEETLGLYVLDEVTGNWTALNDTVEWVNETGLNTIDTEFRGISYQGYLWANVTRLSLFGISGKINKILDPVVARTGEDLVIDLFHEVSLNGTSSTGNDPSLNFTWTLLYGNSTIIRYGPLFSFVFDLPGEYLVELRVTDIFGMFDIDAVSVTVRDIWILDVGPVVDEDGLELSGARVTIIRGDLALSEVTDPSGRVQFEMGIAWIGSSVTLIVEADGYEKLEHDTVITEDRTLETPLPSLVRSEKESNIYVWVLLFVLLLIIIAVAIMFILRRKTEGMPEE